MTDDELMGLMGTRQRLQARQAWELLTTVAEFIRRRPGPGCALDGPERMPRVWHEHAPGELAAQLHITAGAADELLDLAHDLTVKLPLTAAALRDGIIDVDKARIIALRCSALTPEEARAAEAILFAQSDVDEMTWGMIRDRIARAAIEINPKAAVKRREQAAKQRRVEVLPEDSGNEMLAGRELPPAAVLAASQLLTARARQLPQGRDPRRDGRAARPGLPGKARRPRPPGRRQHPPRPTAPRSRRQQPGLARRNRPGHQAQTAARAAARPAARLRAGGGPARFAAPDQPDPPAGHPALNWPNDPGSCPGSAHRPDTGPGSRGRSLRLTPLDLVPDHAQDPDGRPVAVAAAQPRLALGQPALPGHGEHEELHLRRCDHRPVAGPGPAAEAWPRSAAPALWPGTWS